MHPRVTLVSCPTPIEPLSQISDNLGIDLWIKRDDLAGTSFGGNKSRQLEYYLGAAQAAQADTILITGAVQSNFVRTAAACAAKLGMRSVLQLENRVSDTDEDYNTSGNVFLSQILGAETIPYPEGEDEAGADAALMERANELQKEGRRPYVIPLALNNKPLGALGYMRAANEILEQDSHFDVIIVASGSGLTHAGLLAGLRTAGSTIKGIGSCVRRANALQTDRIKTVLKNLENLLGHSTNTGEKDIQIWDGALAPGYGKVGPKALAAIKMMATQEGIILDPVYTAKSFAAIPDLVSSGAIEKGSRVLFVHTGGLASVFAYRTALQSLLDVT